MLVDNKKEIFMEKNNSHEPSPIEFMHGSILKNFHLLRKRKGGSLNTSINSSELNQIIVSSKMETYNKYQKLNLDKPVEKNKLKDK